MRCIYVCAQPKVKQRHAVQPRLFYGWQPLASANKGNRPGHGTRGRCLQDFTPEAGSHVQQFRTVMHSTTAFLSMAFVWPMARGSTCLSAICGSHGHSPCMSCCSSFNFRDMRCKVPGSATCGGQAPARQFRDLRCKLLRSVKCGARSTDRSATCGGATDRPPGLYPVVPQPAGKPTACSWNLSRGAPAHVCCYGLGLAAHSSV